MLAPGEFSGGKHIPCDGYKRADGGVAQGCGEPCSFVMYKRALSTEEMMIAFNLLRDALASEKAWRGWTLPPQWAREADEFFKKVDGR